MPISGTSTEVDESFWETVLHKSASRRGNSATLKTLWTSMSKAVRLVLIAGLVLAGAGDLFAEKSDYWMLMDFEIYHEVLLDRCRQVFPKSVPALQTAIREWQRKNGESSLAIRRMYAEQAKTPRDKEILTLSTTGLRAPATQALARIPLIELSKTCNGGYAATLQSAEFDLKAKVDEIRSSRGNQH